MAYSAEQIGKVNNSVKINRMIFKKIVVIVVTLNFILYRHFNK